MQMVASHKQTEYPTTRRSGFHRGLLPGTRARPRAAGSAGARLLGGRDLAQDLVVAEQDAVLAPVGAECRAPPDGLDRRQRRLAAQHAAGRVAPVRRHLRNVHQHVDQRRAQLARTCGQPQAPPGAPSPARRGRAAERAGGNTGKSSREPQEPLPPRAARGRPRTLTRSDLSQEVHSRMRLRVRWTTTLVDGLAWRLRSACSRAAAPPSTPCGPAARRARQAPRRALHHPRTPPGPPAGRVWTLRRTRAWLGHLCAGAALLHTT